MRYRSWLAAAFCAALTFPALAQQTAAPPPEAAKAPPAAAAPEPQPGESNAERAKTQPGNNAPFWRAVRESGRQEGTTSLPGAEMGALIQPFVQYPGSRYTNAGEAWREVRNTWIIPYGGALVIIAVLALAIFHWRWAPIGHAGNDGPARIERFTPFERAAHWTNAVCFVVLAVSGIVIAFGKYFLLPVLGGMLFGWLSYALKTLHNVVGPLFAVSLVIVLVTFVKDNFPRAGDLAWLRNGGGAFGGEEVPSHRFNAGEKVLFWVAMLGCGLVAVGSGLVLDQLVPGIAPTRGNMQIAHMVHSIAAVLMMAMLLLHIYIGTIGMRGAFRVMRHGWVDEAWAREHHKLWYDDVAAGKIPAQRSSSPPEGELADQPART